MLKKRFVLPLILCAVLPLAAQENYDTSGGPVRFAFKYQKGDSYRILSTVNEDVFVNLHLNHSAEIVNRISTEVLDVNPDGSAIHNSKFMTSERAKSTAGASSFTWEKE